MSRDLFNDTFSERPAPGRSKWVIGASILAHTGVVCALLIIPTMSALDAYVLRANNAFIVSFSTATPIPSAPPALVTDAGAPPLNPDVPPSSPPDRLVTSEVPRPTGPPGPGHVTSDRVSTGPVIPGLPPGTGTMQFDPPPVVVPKPVRPGGDIKAPDRITYVDPVYPLVARAAKVEGRVILEATIDEFGNVRDVRVLRSDPLFDRAAVEAVSRWRYTPTRLNGVPVSILLTVTVTFALK